MNHPPLKKSESKTPPDSPGQTLSLWATASEVGFIIAIPLVLLMLLAIRLDQKFNTAPLFMIIAILVSPLLSGIAIWRKIKLLNHKNSLS